MAQVYSVSKQNTHAQEFELGCLFGAFNDIRFMMQILDAQLLYLRNKTRSIMLKLVTVSINENAETPTNETKVHRLWKFPLGRLHCLDKKSR